MLLVAVLSCAVCCVLCAVYGYGYGCGYGTTTYVVLAEVVLGLEHDDQHTEAEHVGLHD